MGSWSDLTLGDVIAALRRYQPVVVAVAAILIALLLLPEPDRPPGLASTGRGAGGEIVTPTTAPARSGVAGAGDAGAGFGTGGDVAGSPSFPPVTSSFDAGSSGRSAGSGSGSAAPDSPSSDGSSAFPSGNVDGTSGSSDASSTATTARAVTPLRVVSKTWTSRAAGTPLAKDGVPEGTLPVGVRVEDDKQSFVRLAGEAEVLTLTEHPDGGRRNQGTVAVQACQITEEGWTDGEAIPIPDGPEYDSGKCVDGTRTDNGVWSFDLSSFASPTDRRGFALVPGGDGLDFQVAFKLN